MSKKVLPIIILIVVLSIPTLVFGKFTLDCNSQYNAAKKARQPAIDAFSKIALLGEDPPQKTNLQLLGDCVDSKPGVGVHKVYSQAMNGGTAVDGIRTGLKNAGYTIAKEDFGSEGCNLLYRVSATDTRTKVFVTAFHKNVKDPTCTDLSPHGSSEAHFRTQDIDTIELDLA